LIEIFDYFTLGLAIGKHMSEVSLRVLARIALMYGTTSWRVARVEIGPPVMTRLPLAIHLTAASEI
jgi:hypothetical protein